MVILGNDSIREVVAGALAGATSKTLMAPLDRLKLVVQLRGSIVAHQEGDDRNGGSSSNTRRKSGTKMSSTTSTSSSSSYQGPIRAWTTMIRTEGILALWRGNTATILIQGGSSGLNFLFLDWYKTIAQQCIRMYYYNDDTTTTASMSSSSSHKNIDDTHRFLQSMMAGGLAGGTSITLLYPLGLLRTKLALDVGINSKTTTKSKINTTTNTGTAATTTTKGNNGRRRPPPPPHHRIYPNGMRDVIYHSIRINGITSLYQGFSVALISVSLYRMVYLGGYDYLKSKLQEYHHHSSSSSLDEKDAEERKRKMMMVMSSSSPSQQSPESSHSASTSTSTIQQPLAPFVERYMAAQFVSLVASTIHYPFDSIRRRLMMQSDLLPEHKKYHNGRHCFIQIYKEEGIHGYFRGLGTNYIRSFGAALVLVSYDFFSTCLQSKK